MHHQWLHCFWGLISNIKTSLHILKFVLTVQLFLLEFALQFKVKILFDFCYEQPPVNHSIKHWTCILDQSMHHRILLIVVILIVFIVSSMRTIFWILAFHCRGEGAFVWGLVAGWGSTTAQRNWRPKLNLGCSMDHEHLWEWRHIVTLTKIIWSSQSSPPHLHTSFWSTVQFVPR